MKHTGVLGLLALMMGVLFAACGESHEAMVRQLETLERQNRTYETFTSDSLAEQLVNYFDRHGNANERMRSHYILGCVYRDLGEAPHAIDCYHNALSYADTTANDCDYNTLMGINGQMAVIFHQQNLPQDEIQAIRQYIHYTQKANPNDTLNSLLAREQLIKPFYLLGEKDTVLHITEETAKQLKLLGYHKEAARNLITSIYIYIERNQLDIAGKLLNIYEKESCLLDNNGNIMKGRETYYWVKGFYELGINKIDSAEYYFRKAISHGDFQCISNAYKGMLTVYQYKHNVDSVVYYSHLNEVALDSLHNRMQTDAIHQASALYDYTRSEKLAEQEAQKRREAWYWFWGLLTCGLFLIGLSIRLYKKKQEEKQEEILRLTAELTVSKAERQNVKEELGKLKSKNYDELIIEKERKEQELEHRIITLEQEIGKPKVSKIENRFADFKNCQIVSVFSKKALFTKEHPLPNKAEWNALVSQFMTDLPAVYQFFFDGKKLSPLELYTCILLILDYEEGVIVGLTETSSSAVSIAKSRANQKLFNEKSAVTLKYNLKRIV